MCRAWRDAVRGDDQLWRNLFHRHCWLHPHLARSVMPSERAESCESDRGRRRGDATTAAAAAAAAAGGEERRLRAAAALLRGSAEASSGSDESGGRRRRSLRGWREAFQRAAHADAEVRVAHLVSRWTAQGRVTLRRLQPHWREDITSRRRQQHHASLEPGRTQDDAAAEGERRVDEEAPPPRGPRVCCARDDGVCALADTSVELGRGALASRGELELSFAVAVNHGPPTRVPASAVAEFAHAALLTVPLRSALPNPNPNPALALTRTLTDPFYPDPGCRRGNCGASPCWCAAARWVAWRW